MENKRKTGTKYEETAAEYLQERGYQILERNYYTHSGEIDLIARDREQDTICFVEVKYRKTLRNGYPEEAVDARKQLHIRKSAQYYLYKTGRIDVRCRFDVVAIIGNEIHHIKDAF